MKQDISNVLLRSNLHFKCTPSKYVNRSAVNVGTLFRFGAGYTLILRLKSMENADQVKKEIAVAFPGSMLKVCDNYALTSYAIKCYFQVLLYQKSEIADVYFFRFYLCDHFDV